MKLLESILDNNHISEVYFGCQGLNIIQSNNLTEIQLGYSTHPDGSDLCGENEGDWLREWVVIGTDTEVGDPFFVDSSNPELPVYTAMHGMGTWEPDLVAKSLKSFIEALHYLKSLSNQTYSLIEPKNETIVDEKKLNSIQTELIRICGSEDFWEPFIEQHIVWLEEHED